MTLGLSRLDIPNQLGVYIFTLKGLKDLNGCVFLLESPESKCLVLGKTHVMN